jgi:hypothetical protein
VRISVWTMTHIGHGPQGRGYNASHCVISPRCGSTASRPTGNGLRHCQKEEEVEVEEDWERKR